MKFEEVDRTKEYPYFGRGKGFAAVVLFVAPGKGVVIYADGRLTNYAMRAFKDDWAESSFERISGVLELD